jgi:hypothetical protein
MRSSFPHTLRERRRTRADRHRRRGQGRDAHVSVPAASDPELERVRSAGGPIDRASYVCECGYQFTAPVSTTVACPHCSASQAW